MLGKFSDAIAQYNNSVSQDEKFWPAINNIGLILYEKGNINGAIEKWQSSVAIEKNAAEPLLALAVAFYKKGERQKAVAMGENALGIDIRYSNLEFLKENLWGERLLGDTKMFLGLPRIQNTVQRRNKTLGSN